MNLFGDHNKVFKMIGKIVRLRASRFEGEYVAVDFEWNSKYLYEDEFQHVMLNFEDLGRGDFAKTFFGGSESIINEVEYDPNGQPFIIKTDIFVILYKEALLLNEISIHDFREYNINVEQNLIKSLLFFEREFINRTFEVVERDNNKLYHYKLGLFKMIASGKWLV